jgi:hypothetical protein
MIYTIKNMKPIESPEQLLQRFTKRTIELQGKLNKLQDAYEEYLKTEADIKRLEGSIQVINYIAFGELPRDGNHDGMADHNPNK